MIRKMRVIMQTAQEEVIIIDETVSVEGKTWYHIKFESNGVTYKGYVTSAYVWKDENRVITP